MELAAAPASEYFEKPSIDLGSAEVLLFCCLKNEAERIPYFLDYYRSKGIEHFFIIDNASSDGSTDLLKEADDVHYFYTDGSYRGSSAGRLWLQELCAFYGMNRWCLTVDVDELLVYPGSEVVDINTLCEFLDYEGSEGLFTVFLDMFSDRPLDDTVYEPGQPFGEVCRYFEIDTYNLKPSHNPPFLSIQGGPRNREYAEGSGGPQMKKVPLVKMKPGFSYIFSTHSHKYIRMSRITGALLHYKFFSFFVETARKESLRGDRRQPQHYAHYANTLSDESCFFGPDSKEYRSSADLVAHGIVRVNDSYRSYVSSHFSNDGSTAADFRDLVNVDAVTPVLNDTGGFSIAWIAKLWPLLNAVKVEPHFGLEPSRFDHSDRFRFLRRARNNIRLLDITADGITIFVDESISCAAVPSQAVLIGTFGQKLAFSAPLDFSNPDVRVNEEATLAQTFTIAVDWHTADFDDGPLQNFALYLAGEESLPVDLRRWRLNNLLNVVREPIVELPQVSITPTPGDNPLEAAGFDGVIERIDQDVVFGWIRNFNTCSGRHPVVIYADGRLIDTIIPQRRREDLDFECNGSTAAGFVFSCPVPLGYFFDNGAESVQITAKPLGMQDLLRRTPVEVESQGWFRFEPETRSWDRFDPDAESSEPTSEAGPSGAQPLTLVQRLKIPARRVKRGVKRLLAG